MAAALLFTLGTPFAVLWLASLTSLAWPEPILHHWGEMDRWWFEGGRFGHNSELSNLGDFDTGDGTFRIVRADCSVWLIYVVATAWLPAVALAIAARRFRPEVINGRCARCGYDLRATSDQCPECRAAVARASRP